jgi:hypothetical protein
MKASPRPRKTASLSESIHQQLSMYALAASAAGVGALCFAKPAEARIVYTPAHVAIKANGGGLFRIDLNHDGTPDFSLSNRWNVPYFSYRTLRVFQSQPANEIWLTNRYKCGGVESVAAALPKGKRIGPKGEFKHYPHGAVMAAASKGTTCGVWAGQSNLQAYLGLKFTIKGKIHFGWARVKVDTLQRPFSATLTGYAYETIPGKPIIAGATKGPDDAEPTAALSSHTPEPVTLGALALGAPGLSIWRREEAAAKTQRSN